MKVIILAGGFGTRLAELTKTIPKPMVKVGGSPIIVHIMKHYIKHGFKKFFIAIGYKGYVIKKYFKNYKRNGVFFKHKVFNQNCSVAIIDTGLKTLTGGRLKKAEAFIKDENFFFTYGDGISNVNLNKLKKSHIKSKKIVTVTAVRPPARFGELKIKGSKVISFKEKPQTNQGWINGGFFVAKKSFFNFINGDQEILEKKPLEKVSKIGQLNAFKHHGFWKCMDTLRDKQVIEEMLRKKK
tara:strand:+ start:1432 stop:2151 length:720 start_codon:yes stop_codon:yes gene_type:complete